jgi:predicted transcriptional regulator
MTFIINKDAIRNQMKLKGMRPEDLASHAGIAYATALKAIKGRSVSATVYRAILVALELPDEDLFGNNQVSKSQQSKCRGVAV